VAILTNLVNAMKADSVPIHGMILPFIKGAVDPRSVRNASDFVGENFH